MVNNIIINDVTYDVIDQVCSVANYGILNGTNFGKSKWY